VTGQDASSPRSPTLYQMVAGKRALFKALRLDEILMRLMRRFTFPPWRAA
jgi:hypothetical protein